jgi:hypothetical protein
MKVVSYENIHDCCECKRGDGILLNKNQAATLLKEYMACKTPVIASVSRLLPDLIALVPSGMYRPTFDTSPMRDSNSEMPVGVIGLSLETQTFDPYVVTRISGEPAFRVPLQDFLGLTLDHSSFHLEEEATPVDVLARFPTSYSGTRGPAPGRYMHYENKKRPEKEARHYVVIGGTGDVNMPMKQFIQMIPLDGIGCLSMSFLRPMHGNNGFFTKGVLPGGRHVNRLDLEMSAKSPAEAYSRYVRNFAPSEKKHSMAA